MPFIISIINALTTRAAAAVLLSAFALQAVALSSSAATPLKRLVVADFELTGDTGGSRFAATHRQRLVMAGALLREQIERHRFYDVVDADASKILIERIAVGQNLHHCNGCELDIARKLEADAILLPSVFRMSQLVLTLHVEIKDAVTGKTLMKKALDFRGDNDSGWQHAIAYLINGMKQEDRSD
ncbi:MAG: DUF3280 domain-containing protein [Gammaproteobacteria bacterium]